MDPKRPVHSGKLLACLRASLRLVVYLGEVTHEIVSTSRCAFRAASVASRIPALENETTAATHQIEIGSGFDTSSHRSF